MENIIDLHTHSTYSDGDFTPNNLIKYAASRGVDTISITDHDTLLGNKNTDFDLPGMKIIPGIELSAKIPKGRMHILGYNIDIHNRDLNEKMEELQNNSVESVLAVVNQIKKEYNIILPKEEINNLIVQERNIGRPDVAVLCMKYGYADSVQDAFNRYLVEIYPKIKERMRGVSYEECIELILKSGGIPVLAHPNTLKRNDLELLKLIREMISLGLQGIEVYHSDHTEEETEKYLKIANQFDLLISGGTDYHGPTVKPHIEIGTGKKNNVLIKKLSIINNIK